MRVLCIPNSSTSSFSFVNGVYPSPFLLKLLIFISFGNVFHKLNAITSCFLNNLIGKNIQPSFTRKSAVW